MARVLIVDDSTFMRKNLESILTNAGHEVVGHAVNGVEAITEYSKVKPDVVTMDISMPIMTGVEAVGQITKLDPNAKIIMISAVNQKQKVLEAIKNGARRFIVKPIDPIGIVSVVNEVLGIKNSNVEKVNTEGVRKVEICNQENKAENKKEDLIDIENIPGFNIGITDNKVIIHFCRNIKESDFESLNTVAKGLVFIKPLNIILDFGDLESLTDNVLEHISKLSNYLMTSGGECEYSIKSDILKGKIMKQFAK